MLRYYYDLENALHYKTKKYIKYVEKYVNIIMELWANCANNKTKPDLAIESLQLGVTTENHQLFNWVKHFD